MIDFKIVMNKTNGEIGIATPLVPVMRENIGVTPNTLHGCWSVMAYSSILEPLMYLVDHGGTMLTAITAKTFRNNFEVIGDL